MWLRNKNFFFCYALLTKGLGTVKSLLRQDNTLVAGLYHYIIIKIILKRVNNSQNNWLAEYKMD